MIFYTANNISIGRFNDMLIDSSYVKRFNIPLPEKWVKKASHKVITDFNKTHSKQESNDIIDAFYKFSLKNRMINVLPAVYSGMRACYKIISITGQISDSLAELMATFEKVYEETTRNKCSIEAIEAIPKYIEKLQSKYNDKENEVEAPTEFDFSFYIWTLEKILHPFEIRTKKLVNLNEIEKTASKAMKQNQKTEQ